MYKINSLEGLFEAQAEVKDLRDLRDRVEERGNSTLELDNRIDDIMEGINEFKMKNKELIEEF